MDLLVNPLMSIVFCESTQEVKITAVPRSEATDEPITIQGSMKAELITGFGTSRNVVGDPYSIWLVPDAAIPGDAVFLLSAKADLGAGKPETVYGYVTLRITTKTPVLFEISAEIAPKGSA